MLRTIERPTYATLRPCATAASSTCWTRCTWRGEAGDDDPLLAVRGRPGRAPGRSRTSEVVKPGHLGVGGVDHEQVDALLAEPGERAQVGDPAVERQLVHLEVAGVQHQCRPPVRIATASASGIEWLTATNSRSNGPNVDPVALLDDVLRRSP